MFPLMSTETYRCFPFDCAPVTISVAPGCGPNHNAVETPHIAELNRSFHLGYVPAMQFIGPNIIFYRLWTISWIWVNGQDKNTVKSQNCCIIFKCDAPLLNKSERHDITAQPIDVLFTHWHVVRVQKQEAHAWFSFDILHREETHSLPFQKLFAALPQLTISRLRQIFQFQPQLSHLDESTETRINQEHVSRMRQGA